MIDAKLKCPFCGKIEETEMPERHSETERPCKFCDKLMQASGADCCVFCKFSNTICPPQQEKRNCCSD
jgi:hypothetical protein